jgi:hypothetical protein
VNVQFSYQYQRRSRPHPEPRLRYTYSYTRMTYDPESLGQHAIRLRADVESARLGNTRARRWTLKRSERDVDRVRWRLILGLGEGMADEEREMGKLGEWQMDCGSTGYLIRSRPDQTRPDQRTPAQTREQKRRPACPRSRFDQGVALLGSHLSPASHLL